MAELEDPWLGSTFDGASTIEVDKLDFAYVRNCEDWKELVKILRLLRSGREGHYPDLESVTEAKLLAIMPEKAKKRYLAVKCSASPQQIAEAEEDLAAWLCSASELDGTLRQKCERVLVPENQKCEDQNDDHWQLLLSQSKAQVDKIEAARKQLKAAELSAIQRERIAEIEKRKGNECYRAGDLSAALKHYTNSLACKDSIAAVWANRAAVYIKMDVFDLAEIDCSVSLLLDPTYRKAYMRRGLIRFKRGKYKEAALDYSEVLRFSGDQDKEAQQMLQRICEKYQETEGRPLLLQHSESVWEVIPQKQDGPGQLYLPSMGMQLMCRGALVASIGDQHIVSTGDSTQNRFVRIQIETEADFDDDREEKGGETSDDSQEVNGKQEREEICSVKIQIEEEEEEEGEDDQKEREEEASGPDASLLASLSENTRRRVDPLLIYNARGNDVEDATVRAIRLKDIGNELLKSGCSEEAIVVYTLSLFFAPTDVIILNNRAQAKLVKKDYEGAVEDCDEVLKHDPNNEKALFRRAKAFLGLKDPLSSLQDIEALQLLTGTRSTTQQLQLEVLDMLVQRSEEAKVLGNQAMERGNFQDAIQQYSEAIRFYSENYAAYNNRAMAYLRTGELRAAERDTTFVIEHCPSSPLVQKALFRRANIRFQLDPVDVHNLNQALEDINMLDQSSEVVEKLKENIIAALHVQKQEPQPRGNDKEEEKHNITVEKPPSSPAEKEVQSEPSANVPQSKITRGYSLPSVSALKKVKLVVPTEAPRTFYEFERVWRGLNSDKALQASYLKLFKQSTFKKIFKDAIATELLGSLFQALKVANDADLIVKTLSGLSAINNLAFELTMLPKEELEIVRDLFVAAEGQTKIDAHRFNALKRVYLVDN